MKKWKKYNYDKNKWWKYIRMKRITGNYAPPIYRWLFWIWTPDKYEYQKLLYKQGQRTFIYCPHCDLELISSKSRVPTDVPLLTEYYKCNHCYHLSEWDFDTPTPTLIKDYGNTEDSYKKLEDIGYFDTDEFSEYAKALMEELDY